MHTVIETPTFQKQAEKSWSEPERIEFINWISENALFAMSFLARRVLAKCADQSRVGASAAECVWCIST
jgi:hypothetical protein